MHGYIFLLTFMRSKGFKWVFEILPTPLYTSFLVYVRVHGCRWCVTCVCMLFTNSAPKTHSAGIGAVFGVDATGAVFFNTAVPGSSCGGMLLLLLLLLLMLLILLFVPFSLVVNYSDKEWRRSIGCLKLQVICRKRATNYWALLRKMTYKDKASYESSPHWHIIHM